MLREKEVSNDGMLSLNMFWYLITDVHSITNVHVLQNDLNINVRFLVFLLAAASHRAI